jgi:hypothetical protein
MAKVRYLVHRPGKPVGVRAVKTAKAVQTVGIWEVSSCVERLPEILDTMNRAQDEVRFDEVLAAVPPGLVSQPRVGATWWRLMSGQRLSASERKEMKANVWAHNFEPQASLVRKDLGIDLLIGLTPAMVAFVEGQDRYWNFFAWNDRKHLSLVSCYDVREYAESVQRPFEAAIGMLIVGELLYCRNAKVEYHTEDRGCLFDMTIERENLKLSLATMEIESHCRALLTGKWRTVGDALMKALRNYRPK